LIVFTAGRPRSDDKTNRAEGDIAATLTRNPEAYALSLGQFSI
jgi:hypothetical protein